MAQLFSQNQTPATGAAAMFIEKELLKSAGWIHQASGDATTFTTSVGNVNDKITTGASGVGGYDNSGSWWVGRAPNGIQVAMQRGSSGSQFAWKRYSLSAGFTGGAPSATVMPTATDQQNWFGTAAAGTGLYTATMRFHCMAQDTAPYLFYAFGCTVGTTTIVHESCIDALAGGSYDAADPSIYLVGAKQGTLFSSTSDTGFQRSGSAGGPGIFGHIGTGSPPATWVNWALGVTTINTVQTMPGGMGTNPINGKDDLMGAWFARDNGAANSGLKGMSSLYKLICVSGRATYDLMSVSSTGDWIAHNGLVATPWNNTAPVV